MALDRDAPKTRMVQLLNLHSITAGNRDNNHKWIPGKLTGPDVEEEKRTWFYHNMPGDLPAFLRIFRRLNVQKQSKNANSVEDLGQTLELTFFTFGVVIYIKYTRAQKEKPATLAILVDDGEGPEVLVKYERGE